MPKRIENVRGQLLDEARRQIAERGYANTTVRSVAQACGVAVGTVYNYFPSKEMLIASFMAEDWQACLAQIRAAGTEDPETCLRGIFGALCDFTEQYRTLFADADAEKTFAAVFRTRHRQLREQLAGLIAPVCPPIPGTEEDFPARFIAEALLAWAAAGAPFSALWPILARILQTP